MAKFVKKKVKSKAKVSLTILDLLEEKVDIEELLKKVPLLEAELIDAALEQPSLIKQSGTLRVQAFHKRTMYETRLSLEQSKAGLRLRSVRDVKGKKEYSEGAVKERVQLQPNVVKYRKRLDKAYAEEELGKLLAEVFRARSDAIRIIVNAGKVSVHAKELAFLSANRKLGKAVNRIRERWDKEDEQEY